MQNLNYWQRLHKLQLYSAQRRNERYRLFYIWKSLRNMVPSLNLEVKNDLRYEIKVIIPKLSGKISSVRTIRERTVNINGARIFNSMPRIIREYDGDFS